MNEASRRRFLEFCGAMGMGSVFAPLLAACEDAGASADATEGEGSTGDADPSVQEVVVIGAGVAGMTAAYALLLLGIRVRVLEAAPVVGGRIKVDDGFADFPLALGAEWIETDLGIFGEILGGAEPSAAPETFPDPPDRKFYRSSWMDFFKTWVVPTVEPHIELNREVVGIRYDGDRVVIDTASAQVVAERVVVAVPLSILEGAGIRFTPALPASMQEAIDAIEIWGGFKAFFEFSSPFFGDADAFDVPAGSGHKLYYDATWNQDSPRHIYALFCVGEPSVDYTSRRGDELRDFILAELDDLYDGQATATYVDHVTKDWTNDPFARGAYLADNANWTDVVALSEVLDDRVFFAGSAFTDGEDWGSVHNAARSALRVAAMVADR